MACTKNPFSSYLPSSSSSSSSPPRWTYDVFLSFRGNDTRNNFTGHLYTALDKKGIYTFRDDEKLKRGELIASGLFTAIKESRFAVVILSRDYAWSSWCLRELAEIVECRKTGLRVLPLFHYVDPSDVRNLRGTFADAFVKHEERFRDNPGEVQKWRDALTQVANLAGWHLHDQNESEVIQIIVTEIFRELSSTCSSVPKDLVGMDSRLAEMEKFYLGMGLNDVRFIGIWGIGGIGKTTLARVMFDKFRHGFDGCSFIPNIREQSQRFGLLNLQKQLLNDILRESNIDIQDIHMGNTVIRNRFRRKRILLVLDDVDQLDQLEALVGARDWFGVGSRIIITTRDKYPLIQHDVATTEIYEIKGLNNDEALKLFSRKAFKQDYPLEGYEEFSKMLINYADGLPLALDVLGSSLYRRSLDAWESTLSRLEITPPKKVFDILQISFHGLEETEKDLFLDIACFFKGNDKDYVRDMLQNGQYKADIGMNILVERSLITISEGKLGMHDLQEEMGRRIVFLESPKELGERSRLWDEDAVSVLTNNMGSGRIQGIVMHIPPKRVKHLDADVFSRMKNLKYLKIKNVTLEGLNYLPNGLRLLDWPEYRLEALPSNFQPEKLVELIMPRSRLKYLCKGFKDLEYLKRIDLSDSKNLIMTPDFTGIPNLEKLLLKGCTRLSMIHTSLGDLKRLFLLDLNGCTRLESLPHKISLVSLKFFILSGCSKLKKFPEIVGNMPHLSHLDLEGTAIEELPLSIAHLTGLIELDLKGSAIREWSFFTIVLKKLERLSLCGCERLSFKPSNGFFRCPLPSLTTLNLSYCNLQVIPNEFGGLSSLYELNLSGNNFVYLPESINQLFNLQIINVENCPYLRSFPELPTNIMTIRAHGCISLETLPNGFKINDSLYSYFYFLNCFKLVDNQGCGGIFFSLLRSYFQGQCDQNSTDGYDLVIPGSEVPKWFSHQSEGASVNLQVPSDLCNKWIGIALCCVFVLADHQQPEQLLASHQHASYRTTHALSCYFKANGYEYSTQPIFRFSEESGKVEAHHLWLTFILPQFFDEDWKEAFNQIDANGFSHIKIEFGAEGPGLEVKRCGLRLVSKQDIEDLNQIMTWRSSGRITPYKRLNVLNHHFENSVFAVKESKIKRSQCDYDRGGPRRGGFNDRPNLTSMKKNQKFMARSRL